MRNMLTEFPRLSNTFTSSNVETLFGNGWRCACAVFTSCKLAASGRSNFIVEVFL